MIATWKQHEGQAVDGIALLRLLGGGDSSAVYLAERAGERCAVKFIPTEDVVAQIPQSRWELAARLTHPHLCRILQWGRVRLDGVSLAYVVTEYAEEELASLDRPLTPKEAREMLSPAAKALAFLHGKGFAHGRIKPSNILSVGDELKISGDAPLRKGGRHASSPAAQPYDPPELASSGVTPAGDVWSLGVALVEAMTKQLPTFEGGSVRLPDTLRPDSFRDVAAGCLQRNPARRWTVADIAQWLDRGTVPAPKRTRPRYLFPAAAAAGVVALGAVAWQYGVPSFASSPPAAAPPVAKAESTPASNIPPSPAPATLPATVPADLTAVSEPATTAAPARETKSRKPLKDAEPVESAAEPKPAPKLEAKLESKSEPNSDASRADAAPVVAAANVTTAVAMTAANVTSPDVLQSVVPDVPAKSVSTIHGKVPIVVRVQADAAGTVTSAKIESGGSSKYFGELSLKAARQWKFTPGADARQWLLRFEFHRDTQHPVAASVILAP